MNNHYEILGLASSATEQEIRRAYRILARRYHPDVNPEHSDGEKFRLISNAYKVLSDPKQRASFDADLENRQRVNAKQKYEEYSKRAREEFRARGRHATAQAEMKKTVEKEQARRAAQRSANESSSLNLKDFTRQFKKGIEKVFFIDPKDSNKKTKPSPTGSAKKKATAKKSASSTDKPVSKISIIEVSITIFDAITGIKKTVEIMEPEGARKVSVNIPAGIRAGGVVRLRNKSLNSEELVLIVRIASHPFLKIESKGLIMELPITIGEAISGANVVAPGLHESHMIKIPAGAQSGSEVRIKGKGLTERNGGKSDLFFRLMVQVPESSGAVGLTDKAQELEQYYESKVRKGLPKRLIENG